jgi:hypothetical protein
VDDGVRDRALLSRVRVEHDAAALNQICRLRQVGHGLREGLDLQVPFLEALRDRHHLERVEIDLAQAKALVPVEQRGSTVVSKSIGSPGVGVNTLCCTRRTHFAFLSYVHAARAVASHPPIARRSIDLQSERFDDRRPEGG